MREEAKAFDGSVTKVRRASGAARIVARQLLARLGCAQTELPKESSGAPRWPFGVVGSLAHETGAILCKGGRVQGGLSARPKISRPS